jgi:serine/threonine protein phosphatase PrpC
VADGDEEEGDGEGVPGAGVVRGEAERGTGVAGACDGAGGGAAVQEASATAVDAAARTGKDL